jgi:membrane-associated phospholipid phosphatase
VRSRLKQKTPAAAVPAYKNTFIELVPDSLRTYVMEIAFGNVRNQASMIGITAGGVKLQGDQLRRFAVAVHSKFTLSFACVLLFLIGALLIRRYRHLYNPWFIIPFLLWVLIAGILLMIYDRQVLFSTVNMHHTYFLNVLMSKATELGNGWGIVIVLCSMLVFKSCRNWWYVIAALVCNAVPGIVIQVLKDIFDAPRPLEYFRSAPWIHIEEGWERLYERSFPSGHAAGGFSLFCFLSLILPRKHAWIGLPFFFMALLICYTRLYLGAHFFADVFAGSIVGTTVTRFCFAILRRFSNWSFTIGGSEQPKTTEL